MNTVKKKKNDIEYRIKNARSMAGMKQKEAATALGIPFRTLQNWEQGVSCMNLAEAKTMASVYAVRVDWLIYGEGDPRGADADGPTSFAVINDLVEARRVIRSEGIDLPDERELDADIQGMMLLILRQKGMIRELENQVWQLEKKLSDDHAESAERGRKVAERARKMLGLDAPAPPAAKPKVG